jgi:hypothetical protein
MRTIYALARLKRPPKAMRKPLRFLHLLLPRVKDVKFSDDSRAKIVGTFDFSEGYDPFDAYDSNPQTAPHVALTELDHDPYAALQFIKKWGPFRLTGSEGAYSEGEGIHIENYVLAMSHPRYPRRTYSPSEPIAFRCDVSRFFLEQREIRELMHLWIAFRDENLHTIRRLLKARIATPFAEFEDEPPEEYYDHLQNHQLISAALSGGSHDAVLNVTAWLINDHFLRHTTWSWMKPCFEILFDSDGDNARPSGFRMGLHVENLIEAIYMMIWQDISAANVGKTCPNCHKLFIPRRRDARYCSVNCRDAFNAKKHYKRKADKQ